MRVDVPVPPEANTTLAGLTETDSPETGTIDVERLTVPAKLLRLPRLIVDELELPVANETLVGLADKVKSPTPTVMVRL